MKEIFGEKIRKNVVETKKEKAIPMPPKREISPEWIFLEL